MSQIQFINLNLSCFDELRFSWEFDLDYVTCFEIFLTFSTLLHISDSFICRTANEKLLNLRIYERNLSNSDLPSKKKPMEQYLD